MSRHGAPNRRQRRPAARHAATEVHQLSAADLIARHRPGSAVPAAHRPASRPVNRVRVPVRPALAAAAVLVTAGAAVEVPGLVSSASPTAEGAARSTSSAAPSSPTAGASPAAPSSSPQSSATPAAPSPQGLHSSPSRVSRGTKRTTVPRDTMKPGQTVPGHWVLPNTGPETSCFCMRWGQMHWGIDLAGPLGSPILAVGDGVVLQAGPADGFGNWVVIQHSNGDVSIYGHMQYYFVHPGQRVTAGQKIALVGAEGEATGPHLHFEVHQGSMDGQKIDPVPWLKARGISVGPYDPNG